MTAAINPDPVALQVARLGDDDLPPPAAVVPSKSSGAIPLQVGVVTLWLSIIVLLPLAAIAWQSIGGGWEHFWLAVTSHAALESFKVTLIISVVVTVLDVVFGVLVAWMLVRDDFPGKGLLDALIDLPFALPTIVTSLVMLALYGPSSPVGLHLQHTPPGVAMALAFVNRYNRGHVYGAYALSTLMTAVAIGFLIVKVILLIRRSRAKAQA
jgi:sulfate transport system permease protein